MKKKLIGLALLLAVVGFTAGATYHLFYGHDRFWADDGTLRTDGQLQSIGASNGLVLATGPGVTGTLAMGATGVLTSSANFYATMTGPIVWTALTPGSDVAANAKGVFVSTGTTWVPFSTAGAAGVKLLLSNTSTTGNFASLRIRARSDVATSTWNTNTTPLDLSASAGINDYGELVGASVYAQVPAAYTQSRGNHWMTGLKAALTDYAGATSAGSRYVLVLDDACANKAATAHYMLHMTKAVGATIDGAFEIEPTMMTYLFTFTAAAGFLTESGTPSSPTAAGYLAVHTPAGVKYIQLYAAGS